MKRPYVPEAGDVVWLTFDPQTGREQRGRRPAVVLSPRLYNARAELAVVCPITSRVKGRLFEVPVPPGGQVEGAVLADHLKSVDWKQRRARFAGRLDETALGEIRERLRPLLGL
ncbi:MAG: type II toxin-antitoxin system PemK/MazF family toxin [Acidobacteria bacterium]|nr:type II toxin-antitoxin system PemK/MazF family toxin [Acidobacteriota bacterium]